MAQTSEEKKPQAGNVYLWQGINREGQRVKGQLDGDNINQISVLLRKQGIQSLKVKKKPKALFSSGKQRIKSADIAIFSRQLATMLGAGVPLMQSMHIISEGQENISMKEMVLAIRSDVESGTSLSESLAKFPLHFDELYVSMVNAGEQSGTLETLLNEIATYQEKTEALKAKIKKALIYPTAILVVAFLVTAILMIFVIPQFESLFASFGADLPALTKLVISISQFFTSYWYLIFGSIIAAIVGFVMALKRSPALQRFLDRFLLQVPIIGQIQNKGAIARFAGTFSTMFKAGVPMVDALNSVAGATGNIVYSDACIAMRDSIATGSQLNQAMRNADLFPNMVVQMVAIGEESGSLDTMLGKVADFFEREVDDAVDNLTALMEPMIMAFLGGVIGTLVIAMYLPIFKMGAVV